MVTSTKSHDNWHDVLDHLSLRSIYLRLLHFYNIKRISLARFFIDISVLQINNTMSLKTILRSPIVIIKLFQVVINLAVLICVTNYNLLLLYSYQYDFAFLAGKGWLVINIIMLGCLLFNTPWHKNIHLAVTLVALIVALCAAGFLFESVANWSNLNGVLQLLHPNLDREKAAGGLLIILAISYIAEFAFVLFGRPASAN